VIGTDSVTDRRRNATSAWTLHPWTCLAPSADWLRSDHTPTRKLVAFEETCRLRRKSMVSQRETCRLRGFVGRSQRQWPRLAHAKPVVKLSLDFLTVLNHHRNF
jgi:hypothetical protein